METSESLVDAVRRTTAASGVPERVEDEAALRAVTMQMLGSLAEAG